MQTNLLFLKTLTCPLSHVELQRNRRGEKTKKDNYDTSNNNKKAVTTPACIPAYGPHFGPFLFRKLFQSVRTFLKMIKNL